MMRDASPDDFVFLLKQQREQKIDLDTDEWEVK